MHPEKIWKEVALARFVVEEITEAKESLWRVAGEDVLGRNIRRQGAGKTASEVSDICIALKKLAEKDELPLFLSTSTMVAGTPIYTADSSSDMSSMLSDQLDVHLKKIDESIGSALTTIKESIISKASEDQHCTDEGNNNQLEIGTSLGGVIPVTEIETNQENTLSTDDERVTGGDNNKG